MWGLVLGNPGAVTPQSSERRFCAALSPRAQVLVPGSNPGEEPLEQCFPHPLVARV